MAEKGALFLTCSLRCRSTTRSALNSFSAEALSHPVGSSQSAPNILTRAVGGGDTLSVYHTTRHLRRLFLGECSTSTYLKIFCWRKEKCPSPLVLTKSGRHGWRRSPGRGACRRGRYAGDDRRKDVRLSSKVFLRLKTGKLAAARLQL